MLVFVVLFLATHYNILLTLFAFCTIVFVVTDVMGWFRFFMAPGEPHCAMDTSGAFESLVQWVEQGVAPKTILHQVSKTTTRPLCPHPTVAVYKGSGSTDDAANFECGENPVADTEDTNARLNTRLFGKPFLPSHE